MREAVHRALSVVATWGLAASVTADPCAEIRTNPPLAYEELRGRYLAILQRTPDAACAHEALAALTARRIAAYRHFLDGQNWAALKRLPEARHAYSLALAEDPSYLEAAEAIATLLRPAPAASPVPDAFERVRRLYEFGLDAAAEAALDEALKVTNDAVPPDVGPWGRNDSWRRRWDTLYRSWLLPIGPTVALVLLVWVLIRQRKAWRARAPLAITQFGNGALPFDASKEIPAVLQEKLMSLRTETRAPGFSLVKGPAQPLSLPAEILGVLPASPVASALKAVPLLRPMLAKPMLELSGELHGSKDGGVEPGVTLSLKQGGNPLAARTLWARDFLFREPVSLTAYYNLAEMAAIWVHFAVPVSRGDRALELLGTKDWLSYAYFRAGVIAHTDTSRPPRDRRGHAELLYRKALDRCRHNRGAQANLALVLLSRSASPDDPDLTDALRLLEEVEKSNKTDETTLYVAIYRLALAKDLMKRPEEAELALKRLLEKIDSALEKIERARKEATRRSKWWKRRLQNVKRVAISCLAWARVIEKRCDEGEFAPSDQLGRMLQNAKPIAQAMLAGVLEEQKPGAGQAEADEIVPLTHLPPEAHYNLACYYSRAAENGSSARARTLPGRALSRWSPKEILRRALGLVEIAFGKRPALAANGNSARYLEKALRRLEIAFRILPELATQAREDKTLNFVRQERNEEFFKLIGDAEAVASRPAPSGASSALGEVLIVGSEYAQKLSGLQISSLDDLLLEAASHDSRVTLAGKIGVRPRLVKRWAMVVELTRVVGIDVAHANLLERAGVNSLFALRTQKNVDDLVRKLHELAPTVPAKPRPPTRETVQRWIDDARHIRPKVA